MTNPTKVIDNFAKMSRKFKIQILLKDIVFSLKAILWEHGSRNVPGFDTRLCFSQRTHKEQAIPVQLKKSLYDDKEQNIFICHFLFQIDDTRTVRDKYITATNTILFSERRQEDCQG